MGRRTIGPLAETGCFARTRRPLPGWRRSCGSLRTAQLGWRPVPRRTPLAAWLAWTWRRASTAARQAARQVAAEIRGATASPLCIFSMLRALGGARRAAQRARRRRAGLEAPDRSRRRWLPQQPQRRRARRAVWQRRPGRRATPRRRRRCRRRDLRQWRRQPGCRRPPSLRRLSLRPQPLQRRRQPPPQQPPCPQLRRRLESREGRERHLARQCHPPLANHPRLYRWAGCPICGRRLGRLLCPTLLRMRGGPHRQRPRRQQHIRRRSKDTHQSL